MKKIALIAIGCIIAAACIIKLFSQPIYTSPSVSQWYVYGIAIGCIIAGVGLLSNNENTDSK